MLKLSIAGARRILCLGAHSDDIEIGCGGTLLQLAAQNPETEVHWVVFSAPGDRAAEAQASADEMLGGISRKRVAIGPFRESYFPAEWPAIKDWFEEIKRRFEPDLVFTHHRDDRHQDHRVLSDLAWNTFRNHLILEYEIPKYDGDLGRPDCYYPLSPELAARKVGVLMRHFRTQAARHWFTEDVFLGLMRLRGVECAAPYAEAFHARKLVLA